MSDNLDYRHHGNIPCDMTPDQEFSIMMSKALDCQGYNQDMVQYRVAFWKTKDHYDDLLKYINIFYFISAGSQAEGVVRYFESDTDTMLVYRYAICTDNPFSVTGDRNITIFQTVNNDTAPGYTKLKLINMGHINAIIQESLFMSEHGEIYMSSKFYTNSLMECSKYLNRRYSSKIFTKSGPAVPLHHPVSPHVDDMVLPFKCHCPTLLRSWLRRQRRYNWPPRNVLYDISQMEAHVVPVGCKGSETYNQEWRICFTKAEIHLIHCLNDTQTKLYIVLKMISKQLLKSLCSEITSYIMKNIVLWMCEHFSNDSFTDKQLGRIIIQAIVFLKRCVTTKFMPSYMIPERNLFNGRIEPKQNLRLIEMLSTLIEEGPPAVVKRINKLCDAMLCIHRSPAMTDYYRIKRDLVEKLFLLHDIRMTILYYMATSCEDLRQIARRDKLFRYLDSAITNLVLPEWRILLHRGVDITGIIEDKLKTFLS